MPRRHRVSDALPGASPAKPANAPIRHPPQRVQDVRIAPLTEADRHRLGQLCAQCSEFFERIGEQGGGHAVAAEILGALPEHVSSGAKRVFGLERADELIGVAELLEGYPRDHEWYIGLLLLRPDVRRAGLGTRLWRVLGDWMHAEGATAIRLVVQQQNPDALRFWARQGFAIEKETVVGVGTSMAPAWQLRVHRGTPAGDGA